MMVNPQLRQLRKFRIDEIFKICKKRKITDRKEFILQICVKYDVQQRKAAEYLRVAEYMARQK